MKKQPDDLHPSTRCKYLAYATAQIRHMKELGRFGSARNHACACRRFADYLNCIGKKDITFTKMRQALIADFERWLRSQGICRNTSSCYLRSLSSVWNKAVRDGLATDNPFVGTYRGVAKTHKRALPPDGISRLHHLNIEAKLTDHGKKTTSKKARQHIKRLMLFRDLFLFSFCSRGITFIDMAFLRKTDLKSGTITYVRRKTGQRITVQVEPLMRDILNRHPTDSPYLLPILKELKDEQEMYRQYQNALHLYNKSLKELGEMIGGLQRSPYVRRHSWATMARTYDLPVSVISQALGHDSIRTTEIYLMSLEGNIIDKANHAMLESVFNEKKSPKHATSPQKQNCSTSS